MITNNRSESKTKLCKCWISMKRRCYKRTDVNYAYYGARGIRVCSDWYASFARFKEWALANGYKPGLIIDRENNDKEYSPENCRWVTPKVSVMNRSNTVRITAYGEVKTLEDWVNDERCKVTLNCLYLRIRNQTFPTKEKCISTPSRYAK